MKSSAAFVPDDRDRSALLRAFGILELGMALYLVYVVLPVQSLSGVFYLLYAMFWGLLGFGALRGRGWALLLTLAASWVWPLVVIDLWSDLVRNSFVLLAGFHKSKASMVSLLAPSGCGSLVLVGPLVLPLIVLVVFNLPSVKATFEAKDPNRLPQEDHVPRSAFFLSLLGPCGLLYLLILVRRERIDYAAVIALAFMALCGTLLWAAYRRLSAAWWAYLVLGLSIGVFSFPLVLGIFDSRASVVTLALVFFGIALWLVWLGLVLAAWKYFCAKELLAA